MVLKLDEELVLLPEYQGIPTRERLLVLIDKVQASE